VRETEPPATIASGHYEILSALKNPRRRGRNGGIRETQDRQEASGPATRSAGAAVGDARNRHSRGRCARGNAIRLRAFREGLRTAGYIEGQNVKIEYRWGEAHTGRLPELAAGLVRDRVAVMVAGGTASAVAAKAATPEIPIVFGIGADPVEVGLVASLNRPGGNVLPSVTSMALLVNPAVPALAEPVSCSSQAAAQALGLQLHTVHASSDRDFDAIFERLTQLRVGALVIGPDTFFTSRSEQLAKLAVRHEMPAIYEFREFARAGGLMSYGSSEPEYYLLVGAYAGRVLKGDKPADLPRTGLELLIKLRRFLPVIGVY
jgi:ABC-type uncharacterized transport system substrate-binding protein